MEMVLRARSGVAGWGNRAFQSRGERVPYATVFRGKELASPTQHDSYTYLLYGRSKIPGTRKGSTANLKELWREYN